MDAFGAKGFLTRLFVIGVGLLCVCGSPVLAQTGPGGVGATDGNSTLELWLRADEGVETQGGTVTDWINQAGTDPTSVSSNPLYQADALGGEPVVQFDGNDHFGFGTDFGVPNSNNGNTLIVVSKKEADDLDQLLVGFGQASGGRGILYHLEGGQQAQQEYRLAAISGDPSSGNGQPGPDRGPKAVSTSYNTSNFSIYSSLLSGSNQDLRADGELLATDDEAVTGAFGEAVVGQDVVGDVAEVIVFRKSLNAAELTLVHNYLSEKYGLSLSGTEIADVYDFDSHTADLAGIGRESGIGLAEGGDQTAAGSDILQFTTDRSTGSLGSEGQFVLFGHDEADRSFTTSDRPNQDDKVERLSRLWRADLTDEAGTSIQLTSRVDVSNLSLGNFDDYALFVSEDPDFSNGATFYDLTELNTDTYEATDVEISEGDYVAIARLKRTVTFTAQAESISEADSKQLTAVAELNYPDDGPVTFDYNDTGDMDDSGVIEDGGTSNETGTNLSGEYEADGGLGSQSPVDYTVTNAETTIPAGNTQNEGTGFTFEVEAGDDDVTEQTEKFELSISGVTSGTARVGGGNTLKVSIFDNDEDRELQFADSDYTDGSDDDPNYTPDPNEADGGGHRTETFTIQLNSETGRTSNETDPCTRVAFVVGDNSDAQPGTDLSDPLVDFRIKDEGEPTGSCPEYQGRLSATEGHVYFAGDTNEATLKLEINEDEVKDDDAESIILELTDPVSAALADSDTKTTFEIEDDDAFPDVNFASERFRGDEAEGGGVTVELSEVAGTGVDVVFNDNTSSQNNSENDGVADGSTDYDDSATKNTILTVPEGEKTADLTFDVVDDSESEKNEKVFLEIDEGNTEPSVVGSDSVTYAIIDNDGVGAMGPGGVGNSESLRMWLRSDEGVTASGGGISEWGDQSGNGNHVTQSEGASQPSLNQNAANGLPLVTFDGSDDYFDTAKLTGLPESDHSLFSVSEASAEGTLLGIDDESFASVRRVGYTGGSTAETFQDGTSLTASAGALNVVESRFEEGTLDLVVDAGAASNTVSTSTSTSGTYALFGSGVANAGGGGHSVEPGPENVFNGGVGEFIAYEAALSTAQRRIVANYLAAKYGITTLSNDYYAGDTNASGEYDFHVIGIGQENGNAHVRAQGGGLTLNASSIGDGDYVMVGHAAEELSTNALNYTGTGGVSGLQARPDSVQFLSITGSPSFDLTYDLSEIGLKGKAGEASGYVLLHASAGSCTPSNNDCSWNEAGESASVSGDEVTFSEITLSGGDHYLAIGTTDEINSPLLHPWARTVEGGSGIDRADSGWRLVGVPVQGALIDHVQPPVSPRRNGFVTFSVAMSHHWDLNDGGSNTDSWTRLGSGEQVPNGRGFFLYLYDDKYYPVDPEMPLDVERNGGPPGETDVTVGDDTPQYDTALNPDSSLHLLANPYATSFDLTGNLSGPGGSDLSGSGFQSAIQLWDPYKGTYVTKTQGNSEDAIDEWQGFFVERSSLGAGDTELTFDASGREAGSVDFVGSKSESGIRERQIGLRLLAHRGGNEVARDEAVGITFQEAADPAWDSYDASKLVPFSDEYAALAVAGWGRDSTLVPKALESRSYDPEQSFTVPLVLQVDGVQGKMTVEAREWRNIPEGWSVQLVDAQEGEKIPFGPKATYTFDYAGGKKHGTSQKQSGQSDSLQAPPIRKMHAPAALEASKEESSSTKSGEASTRFQLRIAPEGGTMPAEISSMAATAEQKSVLLEWTTKREQDTEGFYVEHQRVPPGKSAEIDDEQWTKRGFLEGAGTTEKPQTYRKRMEGLDYGQHAFRLRQVGTDGAEGLTDPVKAQVELKGTHEVSAPYPNPVQQQATLDVAVRESQPVQVEVYDLLGRRIQRFRRKDFPAQQTRGIQIGVQNLSSGLYFVRVLGEDFQETRRLTVVR